MNNQRVALDIAIQKLVSQDATGVLLGNLITGKQIADIISLPTYGKNIIDIVESLRENGIICTIKITQGVYKVFELTFVDDSTINYLTDMKDIVFMKVR